MSMFIDGFLTRVPRLALLIALGMLSRIHGVNAQAQLPTPIQGSAAAESVIIQAPIGGRAIPLGNSFFACPIKPDLHGWTIEPDGRSVRPPPSGPLVTATVLLPLASTPAQCAAPSNLAELVTLGNAPNADLGTAILDIDAGQLTLQGRGLKGAVLSWSGPDKSGSDVCSDPQTTAAIDSCTFSVARGLPADPSQISLSLLPAGSRIGPASYIYDGYGLLLRPEAKAFRPARVLLAQMFRPGVTLDLQAGVARLPLLHGEGIASLDCQDAFCAVDGSDVLIRGEHGTNDALEIQIRLRPHVFFRRGSAQDAAPNLDIPIQRCPVTLVGPPLLRGIADQALILRFGGRCTDDGNLQFVSAGGRLSPERRELIGGERYVVLRVDRTDSEEVVVTVRSSGTTVGVVSARTRLVPALKAQLSLPKAGAIDFIPTNRDAELSLTGMEAGSQFVPLAVEGAYSVQAAPSAPYRVRGIEGGAGMVALRFAYRDASLPAPLRELTLATLRDPIGRSLHAANVPLGLTADAKSEQPFVELLCEESPGHLRRMRPGATEQLAFRSRDTCRVLLHRERLRPEDGAQALQLSVDITAADGSSRDAKVDQRVIIAPGASAKSDVKSGAIGEDSKPRTMFIKGVAAPFDRIVVRVSVLADDVHYATLPDDKLGAQLQWSVVIGTGHFRLYATTAIPTGLYRVADQGHQGILTLNAGAILRLVWLSKEGKESPIGLESGLMWLGITGDTSPDASAHGEFAVVTGIGLGIPIANQSRAAQTSISLHAWFEYEVSRAARPDSGIPYGFVFGPSITVGDLGFNF